MLEYQKQWYCGMAAVIRGNLELVVVDNGSQRCPLVPVDCGLKSKYLQVKVDLPWNIPFCRNLAATQASSDWLIFTDIDHLFGEEVLTELMTGQYDGGKSYQFQRHNLPLYKPTADHKNTFFLHRSAYEALGGDDERSTGLYGVQESDFYKRSIASGRWVKLPLFVTRCPWSVVKDARCPGVNRKSTSDWRERKEFWNNRSKPGYQPLRMSCPWVKTAEFIFRPDTTATIAPSPGQ